MNAPAPPAGASVDGEAAPPPPGNGRACVYTTLVGGYEVLNEQPAAARSRIPFICLTDDPELASGTWKVRAVQPLFGLDQVRSQRDLKLRPHLHLPDFDLSIYIDNTVILKEPPERVFEIFDRASGFCLISHSYRASVLDEFAAVIEGGLDDQGRLFEQLNHYLIDCPEILGEKPFWSGILIRDHRNPKVRRVLEVWLAHVLRYSRRDQLSLNLALRAGGLTPQALPLDNHLSWFHEWPHAVRTGRTSSLWRPAEGLAPLALRVRSLERELRDKDARINALLAGRKGAAAAREAEAGEMTVRTAAGALIYVDPTDGRGVELVAHQGDFNPSSLAAWKLLLAEGGWTHVVDVGANYGEMLANGGLPEGARIIAIEPNPRVRGFLERTLRQAGLVVDILDVAVSDRKGKAALILDHRWSGMTRLAGDKEAEPREGQSLQTVRTTTLASLLRRRGSPASMRVLLKIDVEGHEGAVLRGLDPVLKRLGGFAALVEILHLAQEERAALFRRFEVSLLDLAARRLHAVVPGTATQLQAMLASKRFYGQDVVLRRKRPPRRRFWARLAKRLRRRLAIRRNPRVGGRVAEPGGAGRRLS